MPVVSIYLRDSHLGQLDRELAPLAEADRLDGLSGRQVTNRSKLIERIIEQHLNSDGSPTIEDIRYAVVPLAEEYGAAKVSLFGSFARGEASESSDIDILLEKGSIRGMQVLDFQEALSEALGRPVDVVTTAGASERFLNKIRRDEVTLYEAS